jgi:hypothetical protein
VSDSASPLPDWEGGPVPVGAHPDRFLLKCHASVYRVPRRRVRAWLAFVVSVVEFVMLSQ